MTDQGTKRRGNRYQHWAFPAVAVVAAMATACGTTGNSAKTVAQPKGQLSFAIFQPFSGPDASYSTPQVAACLAATQAISRAGGILGDKDLKCVPEDTRGDPADAVPAAEKMLAATPGLVGVDGPTSDEASATVPLINKGHVPMFSDTGQSQFDRTAYNYFYRIVPPDADVGYAMAIYARKHGYTRAADVFGSDIASQTAEPTVTSGFKKLGGHIVATENMALDQSSYATAAAKVVAAHPQVIFTETDPQTAATFFTELRQINHGKMIPFIGTDGTVEPPYFSALSSALGSSAFNTNYTGTEPYAALSGQAYQAWSSALTAAGSNTAMPKPLSKWRQDTFAMMGWDAFNLMALAMEEAKTTTPSAYNPYIRKVASGGPGAIVVHSFAQGSKLLSEGKKIQYVGALGPIAFDKYRNSPGGFEQINANRQKIIGTESAAQITKLAG